MVRDLAIEVKLTSTAWCRQARGRAKGRLAAAGLGLPPATAGLASGCLGGLVGRRREQPLARAAERGQQARAGDRGDVARHLGQSGAGARAGAMRCLAESRTRADRCGLQRRVEDRG